MYDSFQGASRAQRPGFPGFLSGVLLLLLLSASAAWAQAQHYLAREAGSEYVFDTPLPADFAAMATASESRYRAFQQFPKVSDQLIEGQTRRLVSTEVSWDKDLIDQGTIAFSQQGTVRDGWWFTMDTSSPEWPALAAQLKAQASANGSWRKVVMQVLVASDANQPPLRMPIPETLLIQKRMDELVKQTRAGVFYPSVQIPANLDALRAQMLAYGNVARRDPPSSTLSAVTN